MATTVEAASEHQGGIRLGPNLSIGYLAAILILLGAAALWTMTNSVFGPTPQWSPAIGWWIRWMITIGLTSAIFAVKHTGARWVLAAFVANHTVAIGTGMSGLVPMSDGAINLTHVVFWTPAVIVLARSLRTLNRRSIYGIWHLLALATMVVSLVFDYRDAFRYLFL